MSQKALPGSNRPKQSRPATTSKSKKTQPARMEYLISGSLFLLTVATIVGFFIQQLL